MYVTLATPENRHHFGEQMDDVFRLRHSVFNEWLKWDLPHKNGLESDKYDDEALHMLAMDADGALIGTWRLMPTTKPYMTAEVFPALLADTGIVSRPGTWDLSRFAVDRSRIGKNKGLQNRLLASLASAVYEFGIMNGIDEFLSVQNAYITPIANQMLGQPTWESEGLDMGATDAACYSYSPSMERLFSLRTQYRLQSPVLSQFQITEFKKAA